MSGSEKNLNTILIPFAIILLIFFLIGLAYRPVLLFLLFSVAILLFLGGLFMMYTTLKKKPGERTLDSSETETRQRVLNQIELCRSEIEKNEGENRRIKMDIQDLETSLDRGANLDPSNRTESKRVLAGFYKELDLRKEKLNFYQTCRKKLETLLYNYDYTKKLEEKRSRLNELQEDHYEDIAKMESMKLDLIFNERFLNSIVHLSNQIQASNSLDNVQQLQLELKELTRELRKL